MEWDAMVMRRVLRATKVKTFDQEAKGGASHLLRNAAKGQSICTGLHNVCTAALFVTSSIIVHPHVIL